MADNTTQNSASARKKLGAKAKAKESSVSDLLSQIEQSRQREAMRMARAKSGNTEPAPAQPALPSLKDAKAAGSPVDSLLVEELRRRQTFGVIQGGVNKGKKVPFKR